MSAKVVNSQKPVLSEQGSVAIEYAISFSVFILLFLCGIEFVRASFASAALQNGVNRAGRYATLGFHAPGDTIGIGAGVSSVKNKVSSQSGLEVDEFHICPLTSAPCNGGDLRGDEKQWMYLSAKKNLRLFFGFYSVTLNATALVKNEPNFKFIDEPPPTALVSSGVSLQLLSY